MDHNKLRQIIARKNERAEESVTERASRIIDEISQYQAAKADADKEIAKLREELKALTVPTVDETSILG